jgi:peptidoglycan lytic transglycosylase
VRTRGRLIFLGLVALGTGCSLLGLPGPGELAVGNSTEGTASFYGNAHRGVRTASGERYDPDALTAAHRTLPFGTRLRVTNVANGRSVVVRVNDRGPFIASRTLDLSLAAARALDAIADGVVRVRIQRLR